MKTVPSQLQTFFLDIIGGTTPPEFEACDLFTFNLLDGSNWYYTSFDQPISYNGSTYLSLDPVNNAPGIKRSKYQCKIGLEVAKMVIDIIAPAIVTAGAAPIPILQAIMQGLFDGASCSVDRMIIPPPGTSGQGAFNLFKGMVSDIPEIGRTHAKINVAAVTELLNVYYPKNTFGPACRHTLFDAGCTLSASAFTVTGTVGSGSNEQTIQSNLTQPGPTSAPSAAPTLTDIGGSGGLNLLATTYYVVVTYISSQGESASSPEANRAVAADRLLQVDSPPSFTGVTGYNVYVGRASGDEQLQNQTPISIGTNWTENGNGLAAGVYPPTIPTGGWFTQGQVKFLTGVLAGQSFDVELYFGGGEFNILPIASAVPSSGDTFQITAGCDKQMQTCITKFNNVTHFGGQPFIPLPEAAI
jgi:hypothetical protein